MEKKEEMKKDSSDSKWGEKFSREKGVSSEIAGRICRRAGRKRVGGGGEKRIISDGRRSERMDERGGGREGVKAEWYVRGAGMRGEYFTRKIQLRAEDSQDT